jgi:hypothetical protein
MIGNTNQKRDGMNEEQDLAAQERAEIAARGASAKNISSSRWKIPATA